MEPLALVLQHDQLAEQVRDQATSLLSSIGIASASVPVPARKSALRSASEVTEWVALMWPSRRTRPAARGADLLVQRVGVGAVRGVDDRAGLQVAGAGGPRDGQADQAVLQSPAQPLPAERQSCCSVGRTSSWLTATWRGRVTT